MRAPTEHARAAAILVACTAWVARPWSWRGDCAFPQRDAAFSLVGIDHLQRALLGRVELAASPLGWPFEGRLALTDWMLGEALLGLPLRGLDPARAYQVLVLAGLLATALACHAVVHRLLGAGPHTVLAGVLGGLAAPQLVHVQHVNLVHHEWAVLAALGLGLGLARCRPLVAALGGLSVAVGFHFGAYVGMHALLVASVTAICFLGRGDARTWGAVLIAGVVGGATLLPVATTWLEVASQWGMELSLAEKAEGTWRPRQALSPLPAAPLHSWLGTPPRPIGPVAGNVGFVALGLALVGLAPPRVASLRRPWLAALVLALTSGLLATVSAPIGMFRSPSRWLAVAALGLAVLAAFGLHRLLGRLPARVGGVVGLALVAVVLGEQPRTSCVDRASLEPSPAYEALPAGDSPLAEVFRPGCDCAGVPRLLAALEHHRPLAGGHFARFFPAMQVLNRQLGAWPSDHAAARLHELGVRVVLEHRPPRGEPPHGWTCEDVAHHRICTPAKRGSDR